MGMTRCAARGLRRIKQEVRGSRTESDMPGRSRLRWIHVVEAVVAAPNKPRDIEYRTESKAMLDGLWGNGRIVARKRLRAVSTELGNLPALRLPSS